MPERGRAGTGAVLSLSAIGPQEKFLNSPDHSFFKPKSKQCTNSSVFFHSHLRHHINNQQSWPFGKTLSFILNPKTSGDVLANAWIKCTLPAITVDPNGKYCAYVGNGLIKKVEFLINGDTIETLTGDWLVIHRELFIHASGSDVYATTLGPNDVTSAQTSLFIPLHLFFCRYIDSFNNSLTRINSSSHTPYFLMCAARNQEVAIRIEFNEVSFFSNTTTTSEVFLDKINLVTQEYTLSNEERDFYKHTEQISLLTKLMNHPVLPISSAVKHFKNNLVPSLPVKSIHWFLRNTLLEQVSNIECFNNRFNFSNVITNSNPILEESNVIMSNADLHLNGQSQNIMLKGTSNTSRLGSTYFKYLQTYQHYLKTPDRNIYTFSFAINPFSSLPTGAINLNLLSNSNSLLTGDLNQNAAGSNYNLHLFYLSQAILKYNNGYCSLVFS